MAGDLRRLRGDRDKKKRSSLYRSCRHERVILPDYRITLLLQFIHHFYNTFTSLLHHSFSLYNTFTTPLHHFCITFTSFLQLIRHFYVSSILCAICTSDPLPERAENGFSGCAGNASRPRNKLRSRSPFSGGKNAGNRTYPG